MNCREFVEFLMGYLDEELDETARSVFEAHLGGCRDCHRYMEDYVQAVELGRAACREPEGPAVPEGLPEELVQAILQARQAANSKEE
ncbi:MAG: zf-HC2 domain-containing protein [Myxococcota bacterium]|nr:zf-HC2 domain-containing protein [Myxococcota bacterium]